MGKRRGGCRIMVEDLMERDHLEELGEENSIKIDLQEVEWGYGPD
jgi:hypothetical protein